MGTKADKFPKWFYDNATVADFESGLAEFKGKKNLKFLQIGVFTGNASAWLLENMLKKAIDSEQYELASKLRDVIKIHNSEIHDQILSDIVL